MKGEAEAFAIEAKAKAESEQMSKKADAWKEYEDAAKIEMMLDIIPKVFPVFLVSLIIKQVVSGSHTAVRSLFHC